MMIATTPDQISYVRLASVKGMIRMESRGLKSRGGSVKNKICKEFGISIRTSHDDVIKIIQEKMDAYLTQKQ